MRINGNLKIGDTNITLNDVITKSAITVGIASTVTVSMTTSNNLFTFTNVKNVKGDKFTLKSGKIIVGTGINNVIVSANLGGWLQQESTGYIRMGIYKNSTRLIFSRQDAAMSRRTDMQITNYLVNVQEGDEIYLTLATSTSFSQNIGVEGEVTFMTVMQI